MLTPRPSPDELLTHPDKRIARQAQKALDEDRRLTELWAADQGKAELRAKRDRLKAELAKIDAELKGTTGTPKPDPAAVRAWAKAEGMDVNPTGIIPNKVALAYTQAHGAA